MIDSGPLRREILVGGLGFDRLDRPVDRIRCDHDGDRNPMIQARHPIRLGDLVGSSGYLGSVVDLNARSVVLETLDGTTVHLPNRAVLELPLVNYSLRRGVRSQVQIRVDSGGLDDVTDVLVETTDTTRGRTTLISAPDPHPFRVTSANAGTPSVQQHAG